MALTQHFAVDETAVIFYTGERVQPAEREAMNQTQPNYNTTAIRRLLLAAFNDEEFTFFCYDHFREVYQKFAAGITFTAKVQILIEHCELRSEFGKLLPLVQEANPAKYAELASTLGISHPQPSNPPISQPALSSRQPFEPEMILIPAGEFLMGSDPRVDPYAYDDEQPQHFLYLPDYYLAKTPITNAQYLAFVRATSYPRPKNWNNKRPPVEKYDHPVTYVSWYDASAYCDWLAKVTDKPYHLPNEAEWEKGARGPDGRIYPWGSICDANRCNSEESGLEDTTLVNIYPNGSSPYGLLDMAVNVWEWLQSLWGESRDDTDFKYPYRLEDALEDSNKMYRALRGGAFVSSKRGVRCADRGGNHANFKYFGIGFRVAMSAI